MPDHEELEMRMSEILDEQDTARRRARTMPWGKHMEPDDEEEDEDEERG